MPFLVVSEIFNFHTFNNIVIKSYSLFNISIFAPQINDY